MSASVVAVDLGATSGRVIVGQVGSNGVSHRVIHRFPNGPATRSDGIHWDVRELFSQVAKGLQMVSGQGWQPVSIGVDSWAVDYALLRGGELLWEPFHYRDSRTERGVEKVHRITDHAGLYPRNGLQFLPINTIYQLASEDWRGPSGDAEELLLVPDLFSYWLGGKKVTEATNSSTTGLVNVDSGSFDSELVALTGGRMELFAPLVQPGTHLGEVQSGLMPDHRVNIVSVGSHDTASAVVGTPLEGPDSAYISCGTWGLVGLEIDRPILSDAARQANFTNEGGVDRRIRFLTNVMGLWLVNESVAHWQSEGEKVSLESLVGQAGGYSGPLAQIDVSAPVFLPPGDMPERIRTWCLQHNVAPPSGRVAMVASIISSLAEAFTQAVSQASRLANQPVKRIHLTGGGSQNEILCQAVANRSGLPVFAGPSEATALGNVLVQARAAGEVSGSLDALRDHLRHSIQTRKFLPSTTTIDALDGA